jgi:hypothetical protein
VGIVAGLACASRRGDPSGTGHSKFLIPAHSGDRGIDPQ